MPKIASSQSNEAEKVLSDITRLKFTHPRTGFLILTYVVKSNSTRQKSGINADLMRGSGTLADLIDMVVLIDRTCDPDEKYLYLPKTCQISEPRTWRRRAMDGRKLPAGPNV